MENERKFNNEIFKDGGKTLSEIFTNVSPMISNIYMKNEDKKETSAVPTISIAMRIGTIVFCGVSFAIIATNEGKESDYCNNGTDDYCWFSWKALKSSDMAYLLAINAFVCFYSIIQLVLYIIAICTKRPILATPTAPSSTLTFIVDKTLTYMLMAGCGAGVSNVANSKNEELSMDACSKGFKFLCDKQRFKLCQPWYPVNLTRTIVKGCTTRLGLDFAKGTRIERGSKQDIVP
ncbi:hypothetical protein KC19_9G117100 [Ceratodon purpureus]|uniref:CASP-like protein n=1 Tax=Ceratodon purpureus TaxID=3225 RepID=A0A8T0GR24_CERPU|nr:hypothetical protein KC19_9G117100 [Ceratodon purpureus]